MTTKQVDELVGKTVLAHDLLGDVFPITVLERRKGFPSVKVRYEYNGQPRVRIFSCHDLELVPTGIHIRARRTVHATA